MSGIIYDARLIKAMEGLQILGEYVGEEQSFIDELWSGLIMDSEMMTEFVYYLDNHCILDRVKVQGYGLSDMYFHLMWQYNVMHDLGKNNSDCDKERIMLHAFADVMAMKKEPEKYISRFDDRGLDKFI